MPVTLGLAFARCGLGFVFVAASGERYGADSAAARANKVPTSQGLRAVFEAKETVGKLPC